jgi:hypothetical protein
MSEQGSAGRAANQDPGIGFAQIVLQRAEFRHREDYLALPPNTPVTELPVDVSVQMFANASAQVSADGAPAQQRPIAGIVVQAKSRATDPPALYEFVVEVAALVTADREQPEIPPIEFIVGSGINLVFPFVREAVANLTMRGRFGAIWLKPFAINIATEETIASLRGERDAPLLDASAVTKVDEVPDVLAESLDPFTALAEKRGGRA